MKSRRATIADTPRIAEIHVHSWQAVYKGILPAGFLASLDLHKREAMWQSCLANDGKLFVVENDSSDIVGFLNIGGPRDEDLKKGTELTAIYLDPKYYGSGIGTVFWREIEKEIETDFVYLWVLSTNTIGIAFYEKNGFSSDGKKKTFEIDGQEFEELRYQKRLDNR